MVCTSRVGQSVSRAKVKCQTLSTFCHPVLSTDKYQIFWHFYLLAKWLRTISPRLKDFPPENLCFLPEAEQRHSCFFEKHHYSFSAHQPRFMFPGTPQKPLPPPGISLPWKIAIVAPTLNFGDFFLSSKANAPSSSRRIPRLKLFPSICLNKPIPWSNLLRTNKSAAPDFSVS